MTTEKAPDQLFSDITFDQVELPAPLQRAVAELGFGRLTRVQAQVLPLSLEGRDVVAQAQTGSGKTAAYLLTVFAKLLATPRESPPETPRALIVAPTRELAVQIASDAESLGRYTEMRSHVVFGGLDYRRQREILGAGTDLLIGTPGRLIDYHKQRVYNLGGTEIVIIDECDRLFDMGFADDLRWLLRRLPRPKERQSMMFTATLSQRVMILGWREMNDPTEIVVNRESLTPDTIDQELFHVARNEKLSLLLGVLRREGAERTMIFVNTRIGAQRLVEDLRRHGYTARGLTGNVVQSKRLKVLDDFRDGNLPILVATDVASRGLHIEGVSHVVNYDLPQDAEDYVHRVGRTARVGAEGKAISFADENFVYSLDAIQKFVGFEIPVSFGDDDLYAEVMPRPPRSRSGGDRSRSRPRDDRRPSRLADDAGRADDQGRGERQPPGDWPDNAAGEGAPKRKRRRRRKKKTAGSGPDAAPSESGDGGQRE